MRAVWLALCGALLLGCATAPPTLPERQEGHPLGVSLLPPAVPLADLLPPAPAPVVAPIGARHPDLPVDGGKYCPTDTPQNCTTLTPGILVDDTTYAQAGADAASAKRLRVEVAVLRRLQDLTREAVITAENAYQARIMELRYENAKLRTPSWWTQHKFAVGVGLGFAASLATVYAASELR